MNGAPQQQPFSVNNYKTVKYSEWYTEYYSDKTMDVRMWTTHENGNGIIKQ